MSSVREAPVNEPSLEQMTEFAIQFLQKQQGEKRIFTGYRGRADRSRKSLQKSLSSAV